jgi:two-component system response regulator PilR (NtrC family)
MTPSHGIRVLIVDDEPGLRQTLQILFRRQGYEVVLAPGVALGREAIASTPQPFPLILTDLVMPDGSGLDLIQLAKERNPSTEVIVMTAHSRVEVAVDAMRRGAYDFIQKPFVHSELLALAQKAVEKGQLVAENQRLKAQVHHLAGDLFGRSPAMRAVSELVDKAAASRTTVLITGESGTGKERVARALHERSGERARQPFLVVNCGALPESLMESELFGHEKGAFTGAVSSKEGLFRAARGGTLFLDEVGELPLPLQVKLLRVLQEKKVRPVGGSQEESVDVRILAATNRPLEEEVQSGRFRQDLYYRLNVIRIKLPPLRERQGDLAELASYFLGRYALEMGKDVRGLTPDALRVIERYPFPGNVRELENMMERAVALASSPVIGLGDLPSEVSGLAAAASPQLVELPPEGCNIDDVLLEVERRLILQALERSGGIRKHAATLLGVKQRSLRYRLQKHNLEEGDDPTFPDEEPTTERNLVETEQKLSSGRAGS